MLLKFKIMEEIRTLIILWKAYITTNAKESEHQETNMQQQKLTTNLESKLNWHQVPVSKIVARQGFRVYGFTFHFNSTLKMLGNLISPFKKALSFAIRWVAAEGGCQDEEGEGD